jgi:hypothetical protein
LCKLQRLARQHIFVLIAIKDDKEQYERPMEEQYPNWGGELNVPWRFDSHYEKLAVCPNCAREREQRLNGETGNRNCASGFQLHEHDPS